MTRQSAPYHRLLGDLSDVPAEYIRDVSHLKRFLERWTMDPKYQEAFASDAEAALTALGMSLTPADVLPLIDARAGHRGARAWSGRAGRRRCLPAVLRYRVFVAEKIEHRRRQRTETVPGDPRLRAWRDRMINRCIGELGQDRADQIVHAPAALELSKGCTVGCWFCGVAAPKFEHTWKYTPENGQPVAGVPGRAGRGLRHLGQARFPLLGHRPAGQPGLRALPHRLPRRVRRLPADHDRAGAEGHRADPAAPPAGRTRWTRPSTGSRSSR